ncbi:class I fructose-bisphosphate aldolase [Pedobacter sp. ASV28]|uniref:class I fructose-bisphosphate aldolase n=1 Tax=Pedobacter sp. ASV28 TaxID=2795123 RepID=UPI0018EE2A57|nr:class I fructose-bisphosphate aldolase [Pedobacter sp. ASV28]
MNALKLTQTITGLLADQKGLLAMDESISTCNKRLAEAGIAQTEENRRSYRQLLIKTPGLKENISGIILFDETIRQRDDEDVPLINTIIKSGIIPGIKVDLGTQELAGFTGERITEGLDGLRERLNEYASMGARFAKWRAVITIGKELPSRNCVEANTNALARYAALCQESGLVPIVEPEVMMTGNHTTNVCFETTRYVLENLFDQLYLQGIALEGMILKPNMILPGLDRKEKKSAASLAENTIRCLLESVPAAVPGIAFLSGGQSEKQATKMLNALQIMAGDRLPWTLTFSFGRALQHTALQIWKGKEENTIFAQQELQHRATCNHAANMGLYDGTTEKRE